MDMFMMVHPLIQLVLVIQMGGVLGSWACRGSDGPMVAAGALSAASCFGYFLLKMFTAA